MNYTRERASGTAAALAPPGNNVVDYFTTRPILRRQPSGGQMTAVTAVFSARNPLL
jgi:hypothetical protein